MKQEQVQDFTRRISQSNRSGLIVVIYDIIAAHMEDAKRSLAEGDYENFRDAALRAQRGVDELMRTLNFRYDVSNQLYPLYVFVKEALSKAVIKKSAGELDEASEVLGNLREAFAEVSKQDRSGPLMQNTQQVYAGMTYGRNELTETFQEPAFRGFFA